MARYIDADLVRQIADAELGSSDKETVQWVIAHTPTADVQEVRHGRWKGNGCLKHCSECGNCVNFNNVSRWLYNYCPSCGAKMDGKE